MVSEPFDVTDDNGITVTGTVDVDRDPNGDYFDPTKPGYKNPRYADVHFDYFNTRGACTIDRNALSRAMEEAFARALTRFGIENPNRGEIAKHVGDSINATRQQCTRNADKYVSNETFSSIDWGTGKAVGNLTAKAYAGVPTPDGGVQTVVARENSWPGADVSSLGDDASAKIRILSSRRVVAGGGDESAGNWGSSSEDSQKPTPPGPAPRTGWVTGSSGAKPTRYPSQREDYNPSASAFDLGAPAVPIAPPNNVFARDRQNSFGNRFGNWTTLPNASPSVVPSGDSFDSRFGNWTSSSAGIAPRNPNLPVPPPEPGMPHGIFSSKPMPLWTTPLPLGALPNNASASSNSGWFNFPAGPVLQNPTPSVSPPQADSKQQRFLSRRIISQASSVDPAAPAAPLAPSDDTNYFDGLLGRLVALMGNDPQNPNQPAPPDDDEDRPDLNALKAKLSSSGNIRDAVALYNTRKSRRS